MEIVKASKELAIDQSVRQTETTGGLEEITLAALKGQDAVGRQRERERGPGSTDFIPKGCF